MIIVSWRKDLVYIILQYSVDAVQQIRKRIPKICFEKKKSRIAESALFVYFLLSLFGQNNLINNINSWKFVDNEIWNSLSDPVNILKYSWKMNWLIALI